MDQPFPTRDPIEGLRFTFKSDGARAGAGLEFAEDAADEGGPEPQAALCLIPGSTGCSLARRR